MKKLLLLLLIFPSLVLASPVDPTTAQQVAEHFFENSIQENVAKQRKASFQRVAQTKSKKIRKSAGRSYEPYYIFNNEDGGFVIVAGDDRVQPILAYSAEGEFVQDSLPLQIREWLDMYSDQIQYAVDNKLSNDSIRQLWKVPASRRAKTVAVVSPLIQTRWNQAPLYNDKCPDDETLSPWGFHPTVGCVACAMGQIMKYWNFPSMGIGSHSYNSSKYGTLSANFGRTKYDWDNMPTRLTTSSTEVQIDAVSTLLYHCGVSVDMSYNGDGNGSSGSYTVLPAIVKAIKANAEDALVDYFGYKASTIEGKFMNIYTYASWLSTLKTELDNKRPILYSGSSSSGGHAFICDGYDSNDYFHFNWGWGGQSDGYFALSTGTPLTIFPLSQSAIIGIIPDETTQFYDLAMYADLETASSNYGFGNDITITGQVENNGTGTFMGEFKVGLYNANDQFVGWSNESYSFTLTKGSYTSAQKFTFTGGLPYITGKYTAYMFYRENGSTQWHAVRSDVGVFLTEYNNVSFNITYKTNSLRTYSAFTVDGGKYVTDQNAYINVDILNAGSSTFYGTIKLCLKKADGSTAQDIDEFAIVSGLKANAHYPAGIDFSSIITVDPGTYFLTLLYRKEGELDWYYVGCDEYQNPTPVNVVAPPLVADVLEVNDTQSTAAKLLLFTSGTNKKYFGTGSVSLHTTTDIDYYKVDFPAGYTYSVSFDLYDSYNRKAGAYYSGDAKVAYSIDGQTYSEYFDDGVSASDPIVFEGPRTLYLQVIPYITEWIGTYELAGHVTQEAEPITVKAKMPSDWGTTISAWVWEDGSEGHWASLTKENDWYTYTASVNPLNIVFVNGTSWNGDNNQSEDISLSESTCIQLDTNTGKRTYTAISCEDDELDTNNLVVLARRSTSSNWFYMTSDLGTASNKRYQAVDAGTSVLANVNTSNLDVKYYWQIEGNKLHTTAGYSAWTSGNTAILNETGKDLTITQQADGTYTFSFADGTDTRYLSLNKTDGNNYFAYYKGTSQIYKLTVIKEGESGTPTDIELLPTPEQQSTVKLLRDGQIYILRGEKVYTVQGQEVR